MFAASRNIHKRSEQDIGELARSWEETPGHMNTLDVRSLLQDDAIDNVEMDDADTEAVTSDKVAAVDNNEEEEVRLHSKTVVFDYNHVCLNNNNASHPSCHQSLKYKHCN